MKLTLRLALSCSLAALASNVVLASSPARADNLNKASRSQPVNSYADFQLHCSQAAYYYNTQSTDCERYYPARNTSVLAEQKVGMDRQYAQYYLSKLETLNTNLKMAENAQNLEQLQQVRKSLSKTIEELEKIPVDAAVYSSVSQTSSEARQYLGNVDTWLAREYRARYQVLRAEALLREAEEQTKKAITVLDLKAASVKLEGVKQLLNSVPLGVFAMEDVKSLQALASVRQQNVIAQIITLQAKEINTQRQIVTR